MNLRLHLVHIWYHLDLQADFTPVPLGLGLVMLQAGEGDLHLLDQLPSVGRRRARQRLDRGAELWIAHEAGLTAFACWVGGERRPPIELPGRIAGIEDPVIAPAFRGRSIAAAAWSAVADALRGRGIESIATRVDEADLISRRAAERIGFHAVASVLCSRIGGPERVSYLAAQ